MEKITVIRHLGLQDYATAYGAMRRFTELRDHDTNDEFWFLEHSAVFTLGINGQQSNVRNAGNIPVIQTDRGGQVTYHGPGQLVVYPLLDMQRAGLGLRQLVSGLENAVIALLRDYGIVAETRSQAPGVYVRDAKIASLGLRVRHGCCYHGLALNVSTDLEPFHRINPCGFEGLQLTRIVNLGGPADIETVASDLLQHLLNHLELRESGFRETVIAPATFPIAEVAPVFQHPTTSRQIIHR
ncbi:MAG: lipoyl(octanoyl) transferase LipB [Pseudomonadota bacterium]|nr:lipoyl(octanoyl) transferase LipB [Pseudomonadota bacterium]